MHYTNGSLDNGYNDKHVGLLAGLNMAVFLLIGKTSALTMNVAGVVKDWMLIGISVWLFHSQISALNLSGYLLAFSAVCWYNYQKLQSARKEASNDLNKVDEGTPLMAVKDENK